VTMRVSSLSVSDQLGGSEIALIGMLTAIRSIRPDWRFQLLLPGDGPLRTRAEQAGLSCTSVPMPAALSRLGESSAVQRGWTLGASVALGTRLCAGGAALPAYERKLRDALARFEPDVLHTNGLKAHVLGARLRSPRTTLVWHLHEYVSRRRVTRWLMRRYASRCDAIVANSASVARDVQQSLEPGPAIHIVPNAVDPAVFAPDGPRLDLDRLAGLPPAPSGVIRVGLVAAFARWKGHEIFLEALRHAPSAVRGYIIGGPLYDTSNSQYTERDLHQMIESHGVAGRVGLTGFADAAPAFRALDVVVHASTEPEPFGLVIAEAMACGRAVITTGSGGAAELIEAEHDALIAAPGDAPALAAAIARLAHDHELRHRIGRQARAAALVRFAPDRMAARMVSVFETARQPALAHSA
jgi:glycosyltransferase involved in cell wall biosynthesis